MSFYDAIRVGAAGASTGYEVERSLRFVKASSNQSSRLERTPSSTGNQKVWTWSCWFKRTKLGDSSYFLTSYGNNDGIAAIYFDSSDRINTYFDTSGANPYGAVNARRYRDTSSWMHMVWQVDALNTTQRIWINGVEESLNSGLNPPNYAYTMNQSGQSNFVGGAAWYPTGTGSNMYLAEVHFSDGNKYTPSDFTETDAATGQLIPKEVDITYGTNGFYLNFSDNSGTSATTLGKDYSGNGNNWTPTNFSVAAGLENDSFVDSPTNNHPTLNENHAFLNGSSSSAENGALQWDGQSNNQAGCPATMAFPKTGKWYWEVKLLSSNSNFSFGITPATYSNTTNPANPTGSIGYAAYGSKIVSGSETASWAASFSNSDNIGAALDMDNNEIKFYKNNSLVGTISLVSGYENVEYLAWIKGDTQTQLIQGAINFGGNGFVYTPPAGFKGLNSANLTDPTILLPNKHFDTLLYSGTGSANSVTGLNFAPDWVWAKVRSNTGDHLLVDQVRGGSKSLNSNNTDIESSLANRDATFLSNGIRWNGNSLTCNESGKTYVAWNWDAGETDGATYTVKVVSDSGNKYRFNDFGTSAVTLDLAEGGTYTFDQSDSSMSSHPMQLSTTANGTHGGGSAYSTGVTYQLDGSTVTASAFISGFSSASSRKLIITVAASAPTLYYYCYYHSGMGGAVNTNTTLGSSNFDGTVQSTAKVNASAGFSIVTLNGTGSVLTFGHGLGVKPDAVILKARNIANNWLVFHQGYGATTTTFLDTTGTTSASSAWYNNTEPTSSVFTLGTWTGMNTSTPSTIVAYCFSEVEGYSKFGSYTANGNSNGTFVFTGFRPALIIFKNSTSTEAWSMFDNKRDPINPVEKFLRPSGSNTDTSGSNDIDFLSNGFKARTSNNPNVGTNTYIYLAFAELPFKNSGAR